MDNKNREIALRFMRGLDETEYSVVKLEREISAICRAAGPEGYICHSMECGKTVRRATLEALNTVERLSDLIIKRKRILNLLAGFKQSIGQIKNKPEGLFIYYRFGKKYGFDILPEKMGCSRRTCFRLQDRALEYIYNFLQSTPEGRDYLEKGEKYYIHRYNK